MKLNLLVLLLYSIPSLSLAQVCGTMIRTEQSLKELTELHFEVKNSKAQGGPMASLLEKAFAEKVKSLADNTGMSEGEVIQKIQVKSSKNEANSSSRIQKKKNIPKFKLVPKLEENVMGDEPFPEKARYFKEFDALMVPSYQGVQFYSPNKALTNSFIINTGFEYFYAPGSSYVMLKSKSFSGGETSYRLVGLKDLEESENGFALSYQQANERVLLEGRNGKASVLDLVSGKIVFDKVLPDFSAASLHPDGRVLFYQKNSKQGVFLDLLTGKV